MLTPPSFLRFCTCLTWLSLGTTALAAPPAAPATPREKPTTADIDCARSECHGSLLTAKVMHGPVAAKKCGDCHKYEDAAQHRFKSLGTDQGCTTCHEMKHKSVVHTPVQRGLCVACHDPHGSEHPQMLRAYPASALCQNCHDRSKDFKKPFVHAPFAAGTCTDCHASHSSEQARLLKLPAQELCTSCHKKTLPVPGEAMSFHPAARDNCIACHDPHASTVKYELKEKTPELCLGCHRNLKESMANASVLHGAMNQENSCSACHVSHFSKLPKLQKEAQPAECMNCHDRTLLTSTGRSITNMAALLKDNPEHHGPIRLGACTACHQPHAANQEKLLAAPYPPEFYAPFQVDRYQLCFSCHTKDLVLVKDATAPTGFKDASRNLHALHVNQEKGRTCRACHEVHASKQPFHIRDSVPFGPGGWEITIKYRRTAQGGTCEAGCHGEKSYDHGDRPRSLSVVALTPKAQALVNPELASPTTMPATPAAGSQGSYPVPAPPLTAGIFPCTACHDPRLAVNTERRELHKPHEEIKLRHDEEHRWCLDCHNAQNRDVLRSASGQPIPFTESYRLCGQCHGSQYRDWKVGVHGKRTGEWDGRKDYLLCVHCHDPHAPKFKQLKPLPPPVRPQSDK